MHFADLFKVGTVFESRLKLLPQCLQHINLQVRVDVVDQELHVLSQLHSFSEKLVIRHVLHGLNLLLPSVVQLELDPLDRQQESEQLVISLDRVLIQEQMERPFNIVV